MSPAAGGEKRSGRQTLDDYLGFWRYSRRAIALVWSTHRGLTISLGLLTLAAGLMPAGVA
jgi:ATP-binding cassette subfamily B protein